MNYFTIQWFKELVMKHIIKMIIIAFFYLCIIPFGITAKLTYKLFGSQFLFTMFAEFLSLIPSFPGYFSRGCYYQMTLAKADVELFTAFGTYVSKIETTIGKNVGIGGRTIIGFADIGDNTVIANNVSILSGARQHNFDDPESLIAGNDNHFNKMIIGKNVFIGEQAIIMANIGDKSIIGAGSVVVKEIPPYSIAVGNPAQVVKERAK